MCVPAVFELTWNKSIPRQTAPKRPGRTSFSHHTGTCFLSSHLPVYPPDPLSQVRSGLTSFPRLHWELICRNVPAAHCDHPVNTLIILSASAFPDHPAMGTTPKGWQFNLAVTDGSYHSGALAPALFLLIFMFTKRGMLRERAHPPLQTSPGPPPSPPHHRRRSSGERCRSVLMWPYMLFSSVYLSSKLFPHLRPPPLLISAFLRAQELLIYIFGHDASQLAVVSPSACHRYDSPFPLLLSSSKWFSPSSRLSPIIQLRFTR